MQTRYYDPEARRFISQDDIDYADPQTINGLNLYAYCGNNPVMNVDPNGNFLIAFLIGLIISLVITTVASEILGEHFVSGVSSVASGIQTIGTGIALMAYGPIGWILGGIALISGGISLAYGAAELQEHYTGRNYLKSLIGEGSYRNLLIANGLISLAINIGGVKYMEYANSNIKNGLTGKPYSRYTTYDNVGKKQYRFFDGYGNAWYDKDFRHQGANINFPHYHGWINGRRTQEHWSLWELIKWLFRS